MIDLVCLMTDKVIPCAYTLQINRECLEVSQLKHIH
jgi:hypothetical protein